MMARITILHGMKRSGNHALVQWVEASRSVVFFNNIVPVAAVLRGEKSIPDPVPLRRWLRERGPVPFWQSRHLWLGRDLMFGIEDHSLAIRPFSDLPTDATQVLLLRDPGNLFASRIRKAWLVNNHAYARGPGPGMQRAVDLWKMHAREFLGMTRLLGGCVPVYYDRWFASEAYRVAVGGRLGLARPAHRGGAVSDRGGGSSFDRTAFDGRAEQMGVLDRAGQLAGRERALWEQVMADQELTELGRQVEQAAEAVG